jgi:hypothetical protein
MQGFYAIHLNSSFARSIPLIGRLFQETLADMTESPKEFPKNQLSEIIKISSHTCPAVFQLYEILSLLAFKTILFKL